MASPCKTCPFLTENQSQPHPAGWYKPANLRRLWNGLRTGNAPGMICHATDPNSKDYGGDKEVCAGHERECVGAMTLIQIEMDALAKAPSLKIYRAERPKGLTRAGAVHWANRILLNFSGKPIEIGDVNDSRLRHP